ncbi:MAG: glycoside hydrolase family 99-like domain-containing protein [Armatimonadota bacterium]
MDTNHDVVAVYFPSWHANDHYQAWYGKGFSEWELLKTTQPLFPGHHQPLVPSWGYFDESDPAWAAKEIDLAADHGVTTFLFDWYWYSGVRVMEEALERGFLQAPNRHRLKFALMWANHPWGTWPAVTGIPGMGGEVGVNRGQNIWLPIRHDMEDLDRVVDYCAEHYFHEQNYWKIDGRPNFVLWNINEFTEQLGGSAGARAGLERMDARAQQHGLPGLYFTANIGCCEDNVYCCGYDRVPNARNLGFESVFSYNIVRTPSFPTLPDDRPVVPYDDVIESHLYCWEQIEKWGVPHHPIVTVGSDVTPRWHRGVSLPMDFRKWHYEPIIIENTAEKFGKLCRLALERMLKQPSPRAIYINAWNEWSEGMYLLPEEQDGIGRLQALRNALCELGLVKTATGIK